MPYCKICGFELQEDSVYCPKCGAPVAAETGTSTIPALSVAAPKPKLAFWGERFAAWLIDVIIIGIALGLLGIFTWFTIGSFTWWQNWPGWMPFFNFNLSGLIYFLYWTLTEASYGQSLGKMIMHLKVIRIDGRPIDAGKAAIESVGKAFLLPIDILLGWILFPKSRQRIFNNLSQTIVIRE
jgi:uncharacterized RDD family membrane protein YckC